MTAEGYPSVRWRHALAWWWVAELVRRHPSLVVWEHVVDSGRYDALVLAVPSGARLERRLEIDRNGAIHVPGRQIPMMDGPWGELFDAEDPHGLIRKLESAAGLGHARPAEADSRTVALRLVAAVLMATVHESRSWTCREAPDPNGPDPDGPDPVAPAERGRRWRLLVGEEPVAEIDLEDGVLLVGASQVVPVLASYEEHDRRLIPTMAAVFAPLL